jgi:hypothetical protein
MFLQNLLGSLSDKNTNNHYLPIMRSFCAPCYDACTVLPNQQNIAGTGVVVAARVAGRVKLCQRLGTRDWTAFWALVSASVAAKWAILNLDRYILLRALLGLD